MSRFGPLIGIILVFVAIVLLIILVGGNLHSASITTGPTHSLFVSVYTNASILSTYQTIFSVAKSGDVMSDDIYGSPPRIFLNYYNKPQVFSRLILANNLSELESSGFSPYENNVGLAKAYNFTSHDYMGYDSEDWSLTPTAEKAAIVASTQSACTYVHAAGYKFAFTPEIDVPGWYANTNWNNFNWTCVDWLDLQEQFLSSNPAALAANVSAMIAVPKSKNPNLIVFVQIDEGPDSTQATQAQLESDILYLSTIPGVNGVFIQDLSSASSYNTELITLVNYARSFTSGTTTSTSVSSTSTVATLTTSSTTTTKTTTLSTTSASTSASTSTTSASTTSLSNVGVVHLPSSVQPSNASKNIEVPVYGTGFTPGAHLNIGYTSNFPPAANAIASATVNSVGGWNLTFAAPWNVGTYAMIAVDNGGISGTASLVVSTAATSTATTTIPAPPGITTGFNFSSLVSAIQSIINAAANFFKSIGL